MVRFYRERPGYQELFLSFNMRGRRSSPCLKAGVSAAKKLMSCPICASHRCICPPPPKVWLVAAPPPRSVLTISRCPRCVQSRCICAPPPREVRPIAAAPPRSCGTPSQDLPAKVRQPASPLGPALVQVKCPRCSQAIRYPASLIQVCGCGLRSLVPIIPAKPFKAPVQRRVQTLRIPSPTELDQRIERHDERIGRMEVILAEKDSDAER